LFTFKHGAKLYKFLQKNTFIFIFYQQLNYQILNLIFTLLILI